MRYVRFDGNQAQVALIRFGLHAVEYFRPAVSLLWVVLPNRLAPTCSICRILNSPRNCRGHFKLTSHGEHPFASLLVGVRYAYHDFSVSGFMLVGLERF